MGKRQPGKNMRRAKQWKIKYYNKKHTLVFDDAQEG
jgi:hypothetical protein